MTTPNPHTVASNAQRWQRRWEIAFASSIILYVLYREDGFSWLLLFSVYWCGFKAMYWQGYQHGYRSVPASWYDPGT